MIPRIRRRFDYEEPRRTNWRKLMRRAAMPGVQGERLRAASVAVKVGEHATSARSRAVTTSRGRWTSWSSLQLAEREQQIGEQVLKEIRERLQFLKNVGLKYLTLDRRAGTLSGGEAQRIRLATQIGIAAGGRALRARRTQHRAAPARQRPPDQGTLKHLRDLGNTVIVVEHDESMIAHGGLRAGSRPGRRATARGRHRGGGHTGATS
jgi:excinuclease ABC subunit A